LVKTTDTDGVICPQVTQDRSVEQSILSRKITP
jgi:hypothetical protein